MELQGQARSPCDPSRRKVPVRNNCRVREETALEFQGALSPYLSTSALPLTAALQATKVTEHKMKTSIFTSIIITNMCGACPRPALPKQDFYPHNKPSKWISEQENKMHSEKLLGVQVMGKVGWYIHGAGTLWHRKHQKIEPSLRGNK